jgi:translation initiation factor 1
MSLVYSTEHGRMCPNCGTPAAACVCRKGGGSKPGDGIVRVGRETQGRKGKGVTVVAGLPLAEEAVQKMASQLKNMCGSGGTCKSGVIEIQGEHRDRLVEFLTAQGFTVKRSGG